MKPIFCGNFEYDARQSEIQRLFSKYGKVDRVDMKSGFAFVYMDDERDAEDAIKGLDNLDFGRQRRRLRVEWSKEAGGGARRREEPRRGTVDQKPAKTLFVINFDPVNTLVRDLEKHFEPYGKLVRVHIRKNFAFVEYETQEEATKALECTNMSKVLDSVISVEYAIRENGDPPVRREGRRSPSERGGYGRRSSPDYRRRGSPVYDRYRSPPHSRNRSRSPDYRPYKGAE